MSLRNFKELQRAHEAFMKKSTDDIAINIHKTAFFMFQGFQSDTPRRDGQAIAGWIVVVDGPPSEWKPQPGLKHYSPQSFPDTTIKFDSIVWISNNVVYIKKLDEGHSQQAPFGFTNGVFQRTTLYVERETAKLNRKRYNV